MSLILARLRPVTTVLRHEGKLSLNIPSVRHAGTALYRGHVFKEPPVVNYVGGALSFFLWYWILYHCYYEYDHLVPSHHYPDPSKFTDEELGIPSDDED